MALYFYNPPEQTDEGMDYPPFVLDHSSEEIIAMSPHKYWKKEVQPYVIEAFYHPITGTPIIDSRTQKPKVLMGRKTVWILDEKKNALMAEGKIQKPYNGVHFNSAMLKRLEDNAFDHVRPYLLSQAEQSKQERESFVVLRKQQAIEFEKERRELEEERARIRALSAEMKEVRQAMEKEKRGK